MRSDESKYYLVFSLMTMPGRFVFHPQSISTIYQLPLSIFPHKQPVPQRPEIHLYVKGVKGNGTAFIIIAPRRFPILKKCKFSNYVRFYTSLYAVDKAFNLLLSCLSTYKSVSFRIRVPSVRSLALSSFTKKILD